LSEEELLDALQKIPENFRIVFNLFCIENIKHDEIAKLLKVSVATSRSRLSRARSQLKKELHAMCHEKLKQ
jgi:RNA polymerase sigma-70 factor (ECF subfamily)